MAQNISSGRLILQNPQIDAKSLFVAFLKT